MRMFRGRPDFRFGAIGFGDLARFAAAQQLFGPQRQFYYGGYQQPFYWPNQNYFMVPGPYGYQQFGINDMLIQGNGFAYPMGLHSFEAHFDNDGEDDHDHGHGHDHGRGRDGRGRDNDHNQPRH